MIGDGRFLDILDRRGDGHRFYSSSRFDRHDNFHHYHTYMRSGKGYLPYDFKRAQPPIFYEELKKPKNAGAWLLGINKFFELHEYTENMKVIINIFNLKGKTDIWWEDVKWVNDIMIEELSWHEFKRLFRKKYL